MQHMYVGWRASTGVRRTLEAFGYTVLGRRRDGWMLILIYTHINSVSSQLLTITY